MEYNQDGLDPVVHDHCKYDTDPYGTHTLCGKIALYDDEDFKFPMCEEHATMAYACMQADDDMLANAY